jgi:hypothetical protein
MVAVTSTLATFSGSVSVAAASTIGWTGRASLLSIGDASMSLVNDANSLGVRMDVGTDIMTMLARLGGAATFAVANVNALTLLTVRGATAIAAGAATQAFVKASSTANFGLYYGTGVPAFAAAVNSLYIRSDASAANTRLYVCTVAAGTWAAVTTP